MKAYIVLKMIDRVKVNQNQGFFKVPVDHSLKDDKTGIIGVLPVFKTKNKAEKWADEGDIIREINTNEK